MLRKTKLYAVFPSAVLRNWYVIFELGSLEALDFHFFSYFTTLVNCWSLYNGTETIKLTLEKTLSLQKSCVT